MYACEPACLFAALFYITCKVHHSVALIQCCRWRRRTHDDRGRQKVEKGLHFTSTAQKILHKQNSFPDCSPAGIWAVRILLNVEWCNTIKGYWLWKCSHYGVHSMCRSSNRFSPVPVGGIIVGPSLVEAPLCQGLLLVENKLLEAHLYLSTSHSTWGVKMEGKTLASVTKATIKVKVVCHSVTGMLWTWWALMVQRYSWWFWDGCALD